VHRTDLPSHSLSVSDSTGKSLVCRSFRKKGSKRSRSSSSSASSRGKPAEGAEGAGNKEVDDAKKDALKKLTTLQKIPDKDMRLKEWRALLRAWHPDKNPDNVELATVVFQFLQKGKALLDIS